MERYFGPKICARLSLEFRLKTLASVLVVDDHAPAAPVRLGDMSFLAQIHDHIQRFETHGLFVFELHTICVDYGSDTVRKIEEITRHCVLRCQWTPPPNVLWNPV